MDGHAHKRRLLQLLASTFVAGSLVWASPPLLASEVTPLDSPNKVAPPTAAPPNKAATQLQMAPSQGSKTQDPKPDESIFITDFRIVSLPNPIVLDSTVLGEYLVEFDFGRSTEPRSALLNFAKGLYISFDDGRPVAIATPFPQIEIEPSSTQKDFLRAGARGKFNVFLRQGDVGGTFLGANWGATYTAFLIDPQSGKKSPLVNVEIRSPWWRLLSIIAAGVSTVLAYGFAGWWFSNRIFRRNLKLPPEQASRPPQVSGMPLPPPPEPPLPLPEVPRQLLTALAEGRAMLVLGAGASAQAGFPNEEKLVDELLRRLGGRLASALAQSLETATGTPSFGIGRLMDALASSVPRKEIAVEIANILDDVRPNSDFHEKLAKLPWHGVLSLTWDNFAEPLFIMQGRSAQGAEWLKFSLEEAGELPSAARGGQRLFLRPLGDLSREASVSLSMEEFRRNLARRPEFQRQLALLLQTQCFLFVGVGRNTLEQFMLSVGADLEVPDERHFVLISDNSENALLGATLKRFGVRLLRYTADAKHSAVTRFVDELARSPQVRSARHPIARAAQSVFSGSRIEGVTLKNIGLFDEITLKFQTAPIPPQPTAAANTATDTSRKPSVPWTVIFGANGCGKSSILRAIGLAFCGTEAQAGAARLLQAGKSEGSIEVQFGSQVLRTRLVRDRNDVIVSAGQVSPVQGGLALVLGFPALRGAPSENPSGVAALEVHLPDPADLLPLIKGEVDRRLGSFKQWLVNILEQAGRGERRAVALKSMLDSIVREVVPGTIQKFAPLDNSYVIRVKTDNSDKPSPNDVPFDDLSQGMTSIFNWLGVLAQRMYDFYQDDEKPEMQHAVVMVDEIDAHLHPDWQRRLVELTKKFFPNVQVLATSHSPLLAGALRGKELCVLEADPFTSKVAPLNVEIETYGMRPQHIMASPIFNMSSDRNPDLEQRIKRHVDLVETLNLTAEQEKELQKLTAELQNFNYAGAQRPRKTFVPSLEQLDILKERFGSTSPDSAAPTSSSGGRIS